MKPFELSDEPTLISFSGGRTSGFMLYQILKACDWELPPKCKVVFANTGREMPETLDFVRDCEENWQVDITWLEYRKEKPKFERVVYTNASRNGEPFEQVIASKAGNRFLPNQAIRFCTQEMKVLTIKRYLVSLGWKRWVNTVGIRADEARRVKPSKDKRWENWFPLYDAGIGVADVNDFWRKQPFDLKVMKGAGNCDGCFLKSEATLAAMWREYPDRMQWWSDMEKKIDSTFHKSRSYEELGEFVDRQGDWIFDDEAFLCQADDGECTG